MILRFWVYSMKLTTYDSGIRSLLERLCKNIYDVPFVSFLFFRGGIWSFILILEAVILISKRRFELLIVMFPPLICLALLFISCPSQDIRYVMQSIECGLFFIFPVTCEKAER